MRRTFLGSDGNAEVFRFSNLHHLLGKQEYDQPPFLQSSTKLNAFQITQLVPTKPATGENAKNCSSEC